MSESFIHPQLGFPTGTLALLFTDIEGSTALLSALGEAYPAQLLAHRRILRAAFAAHGGHEVNTQGDAFFVVFRTVHAAIFAAVEAQRELSRFHWPPGHELRVRMGIHCGNPTLTDEGYVGIDVHRAARVMASGHGGQILLSGAAAELSGDLPANCQLRDAGEHQLKDLPRTERIFELRIGDLPCEFPPLRTVSNALDARSHHLPAPPSPILGRERDIEAVRASLKSGNKLTTLLGTGGTGKTRLALEIGRATLAMWPAGVFFVSLAPLAASDNPQAAQDLIASAVARELEIRDDGQNSVADQVLMHLKSRRLLLLLDNCEHLVSGAAVVGRWMAACPGLQILATSRVPLRLRGEREMPLFPLQLPPLSPLPCPEQLSQNAAVALFVERARAVKPEFTLTPQNARAVAEICARIDGLPLAIELAAARVKLLPPASILSRLDKSLQFLTNGARDALTHHQTLRDTIAWSHDLLGEELKSLFRRLGVFRGGFSPESAERVCAAPLNESETALDVFEGVAALLDHSLLISLDESDGEARLGMLETIREFALDELESHGESQTLRERHFQWCLEETQACDDGMRHELSRALRRFEANADNWRAAWNWSSIARPDAALQLAAEAAVLWNRIGGTTENYERMDASLRAAPDGELRHRCRALHYLIQADRNRSDWERYLPRLEQLEHLANEANLPEYKAVALDQRMWDAVKELDLDTALRHGEAIIDLRRGMVAEARNQSLHRDAIEHYQSELDDALILHVEILTKANRWDEAYRMMEESLANRRASRDESGLTWALYKYAELLAATGHNTQARPIFEDVVVRAEASGDRSVVLAWYRSDAAQAVLHEGDIERAHELLRDSHAAFIENGVGANPQTIHLLVWMHGQKENWPLVARLLGASDPAQGAPCTEELRLLLESKRAQALAALGQIQFDQFYCEGARLEPQQVIEMAL